MKLSEHVENIRQQIDTSFRNLLGRMGVTDSRVLDEGSIPEVYLENRNRILNIREVLIAETGNVHDAYEKLVEEFTFTLFNRLAALKVMEAHTLHPEIVTRRSLHGDRSFAHKHWLEMNPDARNYEMEGLVRFVEYQFSGLATEIPLFSLQHPFHLLPTAIELNNIISKFNIVETDDQVENDIWKSDDVLGWLYESYNNFKKAKHKESGDKTEFNKVSIQSQIYTPRWVVKFLVDNSLGKLYLEMFPDSDIKSRYKIANAPASRSRNLKPLTEIRMIDPATGSGNFLLYGFDLFYDLYLDQIENYGADYDEGKIPELIIAHNLHGVDLDDRAIQLAQLGLYIKAKRKKRSAKIDHFNIVSSDFYLPDYDQVRAIFEENNNFDSRQKQVISSIWEDLQNAYKYGSLIRLEEKLSIQLQGVIKQYESLQMNMFEQQTMSNYEKFRNSFFTNIKIAVVQNTDNQGLTFLNIKTQDAITFLQLLTQKYDVVVANPPYTDGSDFGPELKKFVDNNYKRPYKFNSNLYATFIKRSNELLNDNGFYASIQPLTFMYLKSFEEVREYILKNTKIEILVELGLGGVFMTNYVVVYAAASVLRKTTKPTGNSLFFNFQAYHGKLNKEELFASAYNNYCQGIQDKHNYCISQEKLKIIESWPFIYWISDGFRIKFKENTFEEISDVAEGCNTANNERFLRFWWEIGMENINIKWIPYAKGGPYNKWYGNIWLTVNWENEGFEIKNFTDNNGNVRSRPQNEIYYKKEGITFTGAGSKGPSFRYLPSGCIFDTGSRSIFPKTGKSIYFLLSLLNSSLSLYIANCLNPTVSTTVGDIKRIPFAEPDEEIEKLLSLLSYNNVELKKQLNTFRIFESDYKANPLSIYKDNTLKNRLLSYLTFENAQVSFVLLNEAIIDESIFELYNLSDEDRKKVKSNMGEPVGNLAVLESAKIAYLSEKSTIQENIQKHIEQLPILFMEEHLIDKIKLELYNLYQSNYGLEEFCIQHNVNPINVWFWFKECKVLPQARSAEIALEFLADAFRTILMADDNGIVPLVGFSGESRLVDRLEQHCFHLGFTSAQFLQLEELIDRPMDEYIEHYFFCDFSNLLNLFRHLPKTPFIWHLSSGEHQGFEAYIIIYKWSRDSLYKLKSSYLTHRTESLQYRLILITESTSAQSQNEKEKIRLQLQEIETFSKKIDELIAEGYDPKLDDGVGKNIAPLQKKGMLRAEVLNKKQLEKYLKADW